MVEHYEFCFFSSCRQNEKHWSKLYLKTRKGRSIQMKSNFIQHVYVCSKTHWLILNWFLSTTHLAQGMTAIYYASLKKYLSNTENVLVRWNEILSEKYEILSFFYSQKYTTPMHKICRHGFKQDLRILCLTNERLYNFSAKKASMKEVNLLTDISGISCTPFKDGIVCIHTKADDWDRVSNTPDSDAPISNSWVHSHF